MLRYLKVRFEGTHMISWCYATWRYTWKLHISADPCLGQGRGRAWDHCRCGTGFCRFKPAVCLQSHLLLGRTSLPFVRPQTRKMPCGSFDQALWPQAFVVRAFKPAICLQSHLFLGRSSLPFASRQTRKMLRGATGIPRHSGKTPYKDPQSWSCRCSHVNFSLPRSGFSRKAALDILSFAMAWCSTCPVSAAQALARSLFTWYFTAFVAKIAFARANFAEAAGGGELMAVGCGRTRGRRHPGASPFYMFMGKANHCRDHSSGVGGKQEPL